MPKTRADSLDIFLLGLFPILALILSLSLRPIYLVSIFLFYGAPAVYLLLRYRNYTFALKDFLFTIIFAAPFAIIIDYIGTVNRLWFVPQSFFTSRFLGIVSLEDFVWMVVGAYLIIIFYSTFLDKGRKEFVDHKMVRFIVPAAVALGLFFGLVLTRFTDFLYPSRFLYFLLCGVFILLPTVLFLLRFPKFFKKSFGIIGYFFYVTVLYEFTATHLQQWIFPGQYLMKPLSLLGLGAVPIEELFYVGIVGPVALIAFYEFFDDDLK